MKYLRNLLIFTAFSIIVAACGGGNTTIQGNNPNNVTTNPNNNTGSPTGTPTSGTGPVTSTTGSVKLLWTAPATRADNSSISLSDISGFRIYYGPTATDTPEYVNINDGSATQYTISLPSGSYYFRISAIDSNGYEGLKSNAVKKTL